jgi:hypothetical protein
MKLLNWRPGPAIRNGMPAIGARDPLEFHGNTKTDIPGGGGCLGFAWGSRESSFGAGLLDMGREGAPFAAGATQRGGVYVPAFILPIPIMASTETAACEELSRRIHDRLMRNGP